MQDWQVRVVEEHDELDGRVFRLGGFLGSPQFLELSSISKDHLTRQYEAMRMYLGLLKERMSLF